MTLEQLKTLVIARVTPPASAALPVLRLSATDTPARVVAALQEYFGADDTRDSLGLLFPEGEYGLLLRSDLYQFSAEITRGLGDSDAGSLAGNPSDLQLIRLRCPASGCDCVLLVTSFEETEPPECPAHPGTHMIPEI